MRTILLATALIISITGFAQPANDACGNAAPALCGSVIAGTTENATTDAASTCGTPITAPGVWYVLAGSDEQVTVSTCPDEAYDTKLNVYRGSCGSLVCVAGNDDAGPEVYCSTVGFWAEAGTNYYILVQGYGDETGPFNLTITCTEPTEDICLGALPIACGESIDGTTVEAGADSAPFCETPITAPGLWYTFTGTGGQMVLSTCPDETFDTKLNVYAGPCDALTCIAGNDDANGDVLCSTVTFNSTAGQAYYVLLQGYNGQTGAFTLSLTCPSCGTPTAPQAFPMDVSAMVTWVSPNPGSMFQIEYGEAGFAPGSGTVINGSTGIDGPPVNITGLNPSTAYDVYVTELCAGGNSDAAGPISFTTLAEPPAANALCSGALPIACGGDVNGDTSDGVFTPGPACGSANITAAGLWYTFTGNGDDATLSTCSGSGYDTKISVFSGSCSALVCVAGNDDGPNCPANTSSTTFQTVPGTEYLVLVHGYDQDQGAFTLSLTCAPACSTVENDDCSSATLLTVQPTGGCESSTGSNMCAFAPPVPNPPCDPYANIVDTWYSFNSGGGTDHVLILEAGSAQLINAAVYTACANPVYVTCVTEVADEVQLPGLAPNTDYLVRVWNGGGAEAGTFNICVEANMNLGVAEAAQTSMLIHPNPASSSFSIRINEAFSLLRVIDASGRCVWQSRPTGAATIVVDAERMPPGLYMVMADERAVGRVVIAR